MFVIFKKMTNILQDKTINFGYVHGIIIERVVHIECTTFFLPLIQLRIIDRLLLKKQLLGYAISIGVCFDYVRQPFRVASSHAYSDRQSILFAGFQHKAVAFTASL